MYWYWKEVYYYLSISSSKNVELIEIALTILFVQNQIVRNIITIVLNLKKHAIILKITPFDDLFQWKFLENSVEQFEKNYIFKQLLSNHFDENFHWKTTHVSKINV